MVQDVSINHRRRHVFMAQQFLNRADVIAILQQVRCERMPQRMRGCRLCNASVSYRDLDGLLDCRSVNVMAALLFGFAIDPPFCLRKNKLPAQFRGSVRILAVQALRAQ